jgi:hypothetical protein
MLFILISIFITVICVIIGFGNDNSRIRENSLIGLFLGVIFSCIIIFLGGVITFSTTNAHRFELESYYYNNKALMQEATQEILEGVEPGATIYFDAARLGHIQVFAGSVREYNTKTMKYNKDVRSRRYWEKNWMLGMFIVDMDPEVTYLPTLGIRN